MYSGSNMLLPNNLGAFRCVAKSCPQPPPKFNAMTPRNVDRLSKHFVLVVRVQHALSFDHLSGCGILRDKKSVLSSDY